MPVGIGTVQGLSDLPLSLSVMEGARVCGLVESRTAVCAGHQRVGPPLVTDTLLLLLDLESDAEGPGFLAHARVFPDRAEVHSTRGCLCWVEFDDTIRRCSQLLMDLAAKLAHLMAL